MGESKGGTRVGAVQLIIIIRARSSNSTSEQN